MKVHYKNAFTLVELLVVIAIVGLLSSVAIVSLSSSRTKAKIAAGQHLSSTIQTTASDLLVGEWLFDNGNAADTSGNGNNGTITGATSVAGYNGKLAYRFTSGANYISLGSSSILNPAQFTISAWVKTANVTGSYNDIYSNTRDCCGVYNGIRFAIINSRLYGMIYNSSASYLGSNKTIPNNSDWMFVVFSYDGATQRLYIDGALDNSQAAALGVGQPASWGNYIGALANCPGGCGMDGTIDDVRIYSKAFEVADIQKLYAEERKAHPLASALSIN